jgi:hypothetical protein
MPPADPRAIRADVLACLAFYTRFPVNAGDPAGRSFAAAQWAAPVAGLAVALCGAAVYALASLLALPAQLAALLAVAATMLASGALHEDGLSDTLDGFGGGRTRERKLEIMRDSRIGSYGVARPRSPSRPGGAPARWPRSPRPPPSCGRWSPPTWPAVPRCRSSCTSSPPPAPTASRPASASSRAKRRSPRSSSAASRCCSSA